VLIVGREGLSDFFQATTPPADPWRDGAKAMEENRMNTVDLGEIVGGSGQASMILRGKRELSKANIHFHISPGLLL
jgi:hypothetical protein